VSFGRNVGRQGNKGTGLGWPAGQKVGSWVVAGSTIKLSCTPHYHSLRVHHRTLLLLFCIFAALFAAASQH